MAVFTFVYRKSGSEWIAKQLSGDLEGSSDTCFELQRKLVQAALSADPSGGVLQSSFSLITPSSAVFQVITGGGGFIRGGAAAAAPSGGGSTTTEAAPAEEKKEDKESDDDMIFSLFD